MFILTRKANILVLYFTEQSNWLHSAALFYFIFNLNAVTVMFFRTTNYEVPVVAPAAVLSLL